MHSHAHGNPGRQIKNQKLSRKKKIKVGNRWYNGRCKSTKATNRNEIKRSPMDRRLQKTQNKKIQKNINTWDPHPNDLQLAKIDKPAISINIKWTRITWLTKNKANLWSSTKIILRGKKETHNRPRGRR